MIKVKHLLDAAEEDDGRRIWVEPVGLTRDLREWCRVDQVLSHLGPAKALWEWLQDHPQGYEHFRALYHQTLGHSSFRPAIQDLARAATHENFTLLHAAEDPLHNPAAALQDFLNMVAAWTVEG